jgi:hypothetical protein
MIVMREWMYVLSPILIAGYFFAFPGQLHEFVVLVERVLH